MIVVLLISILSDECLIFFRFNHEEAYWLLWYIEIQKSIEALHTKKEKSAVKIVSVTRHLILVCD